MSERLLVCGGRRFTNQDCMFSVLDQFLDSHEVTIVIEGEAKGADIMARAWAIDHEIPVERYPALWGLYGKAAGPIRNQQMLDEGRPTYAFAFYDVPRDKSRGTADMVRRLKAAEIPVEEVGP